MKFLVFLMLLGSSATYASTSLPSQSAVSLCRFHEQANPILAVNGFIHTCLNLTNSNKFSENAMNICGRIYSGGNALNHCLAITANQVVTDTALQVYESLYRFPIVTSWHSDRLLRAVVGTNMDASTISLCAPVNHPALYIECVEKNGGNKLQTFGQWLKGSR